MEVRMLHHIHVNTPRLAKSWPHLFFLLKKPAAFFRSWWLARTIEYASSPTVAVQRHWSITIRYSGA
jgi:TorA maturation chaperone TorD